MSSPELSPSRRRAILAALLGLAAGLRLLHWAAVRETPFFAQLVMDSQQYDRWAQGLASGHWLGGGVFFQAPLYPYLLAAVYAVAGHRLDAVYLLQIAAAVAGLYGLYRAGREVAGEPVGLAAAGLGAIYGPFLFYDVQLLKESLAVSVVGFLLWALAVGWKTGRIRPWLAAGVLTGILALLRENALLVAPALLAVAAWSGRGPQPTARAWWLRLGAFCLGAALPLAPVALRNASISGTPFPTTFNGGITFYIGNNPRADGTYRPIVPGRQIPALELEDPVRLAEQEAGHPLTPAAVSRFWLGKSLAWVRAHPGDFLRLQLAKLRLFWGWYELPDAVDYYYVRTISPALGLPLLDFGGVTLLAALGLWFLRGRFRDYAPVLVFLAAWTAATVIFFLFARYRLPAVPALLLLAALPVAALGRSGGTTTRTKIGLALACLAAWGLPHLAGFAPRMDLVHYNLGRLAEEAGRPDEAAAHYREVLAVAPDDFLANLNLGSYAARHGRLDAALALFTRAATAEPDSDDAQANLGSALLSLGRLPEAQAHLDRALAANARNRAALQSRALLALRLGDNGGARELNRRLLALEPGNPAALRLEERLRGLP